MLESLKKSDKVITSSGMHGTIVDIDGATMTIQIADNVKVKFDKSAIVSKQPQS
jgi:preprotein translocase subunit YajC